MTASPCVAAIAAIEGRRAIRATGADKRHLLAGKPFDGARVCGFCGFIVVAGSQKQVLTGCRIAGRLSDETL